MTDPDPPRPGDPAAREFDEDDLLPLSALAHLLFCERRAALIHLEQAWADNRFTVEGTHLHRNADTGPDESRGDLRIARGVPLRSLRLGLIGRADVVEYRRSSDGAWRPCLVEYKRGRPKRDHADAVQLCAQALCLEEMHGVEIPTGALFYGQTRRRQEVPFDAELRALTERSVRRLHELIRGGVTPVAPREPKCGGCSLERLCLPDATGAGRSARRYLERALAHLDPVVAAEGSSTPSSHPA